MRCPATEVWFYRDDTPETLTYHIPLAQLQKQSQQVLCEHLGFDPKDVYKFYTTRTSDDRVLVEVRMNNGKIHQYTGYYTDATLVLE